MRGMPDPSILTVDRVSVLSDGLRRAMASVIVVICFGREECPASVAGGLRVNRGAVLLTVP